MDNAMVMAGQRLAANRRQLGRIAMFAVGVSLAFALVMALFVDQAGAQINIGQFVCPLLINLRNSLGGFFASIFDALLAAFGCVISGG